MADEIIKSLAEKTGLPTDPVLKELRRLVEASGYNENELTLEQVREILAEYLQDVFVELLESA